MIECMQGWRQAGLLCAAVCWLVAASPVSADELPEVSAQPPWLLHHRDDDLARGFALYRRKPAGSQYVAYRLEAVVEASPAVVADAAAANVADPEASPDNVEKTTLLREADVIVVYSYVDLPLVSDRDVTTRVERSYDAATGTHRLAWRATDEGPDPRRGVVRLEKSNGTWAFSPLGEARTRVVYETHTEVGGSIPAWLVNSLMNDTLEHEITGLRERVRGVQEAEGG